jgi:tRNA threonylcarbamoyladenosine biosynthesis protein TsaE
VNGGAELIWDSPAPEETHALGERIGRALRGGDVLALTGPLGAGKTQFMKGLAIGLGVPPDEPVISPTFVLARQYSGRLTLYHLDAYRLSGSADVLDLGFDEMLADPDGVVAVEWADRIRETLPATVVWLDFEHMGPTARRVRIQGPAERVRELAAAVAV